ncbi:DUF2264 domain-containing protein [Streptomyces sp. TLI_171]|uniref:DUF2264 domain-containing protein n=1 Tax=Streptomyces sp. TLI_171 TaxID=1938859 RepID=UPI000C17A962|nr:DUF2264 domain-containing protein [Streptomyces sp. TLI_171]RKE18444.1 hypothetical protein BX266_1734 [Streptomyces sp. TLI_171]
MPHPLPLPPEDRELSPYTGWTRAHWEAAADHLLAAVRPYAGPGHALINLPGARPSWSGRRSDGLEGYARTFLLAAIRVAGAGGADPNGLLERYAEGLATGTRHPTAERELADGDLGSWGAVTDRGQAMVEAASVALGLRLTRPWLWDRLDPAVQERAGAWLAQALHRQPVDNNWWLFPLTVGGFLAEVGIDTDAARAALDRGLDRLDGWYLGDGWYTDGRPRAIDHYNGWALHLYPALHAHLAADPALTARHGARLHAHLTGYARLFDGTGAPVHQGRSLSYRFAAAAPLWAGALLGATPLEPGATRRLASGALRHFLDRGALDDRGLLTLGWHGPYPPIVQPYSGPASPYWASKGFLGLLLPPDHPVWTATEAPGPAETADAVTALPAPGWLIQSTVADGLVRLHNHGSDDQPAGAPLPDDPLYSRLAHSTRTGPSAAAGDNHFALLVDGARTERGPITPLGADTLGPVGRASSAHRPHHDGAPLPGVTVTSLTLAHGPDEVRVHLVTGAAPGTAVREGGWAVAGVRTAAVDGLHARVDGDDRLSTELLGLHGWSAAGTVAAPEGTAFGPDAAAPVLEGALASPLFAAAARLTAAPDGLPPLDALTFTATPDATGWRLALTWPDGTTTRATLTAAP